MHWSSGLIGYFSTYLLGTVMSVQIWEKAEEELGDLEDQLERGEFAPLRTWLGEHIHSQGRKYTPPELLQRVTGSADRCEAVSRVSEAEVRRARRRLTAGLPLAGTAP